MFLIFLVEMCAAGPAMAQSPPVILDGPARDLALRYHIDAYLEDGNALKPGDFIGPEARPMSVVSDLWPNFGYTSDRVWLRFSLVNTSDFEQWRLYFRENFKQEFAVFAVRPDNSIETLYEINRDSPFGARAIRYPKMVAPLRLAPGESVSIIVRYRSEGASHIAFAIETLESFSEIVTKRTAKNYIFYGMVILLVVVAVLALAVFRRRIFAAYTAYATASLLYIMHADGVAFQVLWPNWPHFNSMASVVTGTGIILCGAIYARIFLETPEKHPWLDKALVGVIAITLVLNVTLWTTHPQLLKKLLVIFSMVAILLFAVSGIAAARTRFREVRFYVIAWLGVVASALLLNARHVLGIEISQDVQYDSMRTALVFDALMMGLAIADRYNTLRRARHLAQDAALHQARENTRLAARLSYLGERYEHARASARSRGEILEDTVHDLRQPMQGLRLAIDRIAAGSPQTSAQPDNEMNRLEASLNYMEQLIEDRIQSSELVDEARYDEPPREAQPGCAGVHSVLTSVRNMFLQEAEAKGIDLRLRLGAPDRQVSSFALMRVVSNLVSNAVKFTDSGRVLIALRPAEHGLRIEVHDTGQGMAPDEFTHALSRKERLNAGLEGPEGSGLGLYIATRIAYEENWSLRLVPGRRSGTTIALDLGQLRCP